VGSLATIDAWIAPPKGKHGFHAAEVAERQAVGPTPDPSDGERVYQSMIEFNAARAGSRDPKLVRNLVKPLRALYTDMVEDTWTLIWKAVDRERRRPEAASVARRARGRTIRTPCASQQAHGTDMTDVVAGLAEKLREANGLHQGAAGDETGPGDTSARRRPATRLGRAHSPMRHRRRSRALLREAGARGSNPLTPTST
jgi:hypothetical protein